MFLNMISDIKRIAREVCKALEETPAPHRKYYVLLIGATCIILAYVIVDLMNLLVVHFNEVYLIVAIPASLIAIIEWLKK